MSDDSPSRILNADGTYRVKGTERKIVLTSQVPAGTCIETSYYDPATDKLLRRDIEIKVSPEIMQEIRNAASGRIN